MNRIRGIMVALLVGALAAMVIGGATALAESTHPVNQRQAPAVRDCDPTFTPSQAPAGTVVGARFIDVVPMLEFNAYFQTTGQPDVLVAHGHADMLGVALFSFTVPSGASDGAHTILIRDVSGNCEFTGSFTVGPLVTPVPTVPTTPVASPTTSVPTTTAPTPTVAPPSAGTGSSALGLRDVTPAAVALLLFGMTCFILAMSRRPRPMVVFSNAKAQSSHDEAVAQVTSDDATAQPARRRGAVLASTAVIAGAVAVWFTKKRR